MRNVIRNGEQTGKIFPNSKGYYNFNLEQILTSDILYLQNFLDLKDFIRNNEKNKDLLIKFHFLRYMKNNSFILLMNNGYVVGYLTFEINGNTCNFDYIFLDEDLRGKGNDLKLLIYLFDRLNKLEISILYINGFSDDGIRSGGLDKLNKLGNRYGIDIIIKK